MLDGGVARLQLDPTISATIVALLNKAMLEWHEKETTKCTATLFRLYKILRIYQANEKDAKRHKTITDVTDLIGEFRAIFLG